MASNSTQHTNPVGRFFLALCLSAITAGSVAVPLALKASEDTNPASPASESELPNLPRSNERTSRGGIERVLDADSFETSGDARTPPAGPATTIKSKTATDAVREDEDSQVVNQPEGSDTTAPNIVVTTVDATVPDPTVTAAPTTETTETEPPTTPTTAPDPTTSSSSSSTTVETRPTNGEGSQGPKP